MRRRFPTLPMMVAALAVLAVASCGGDKPASGGSGGTTESSIQDQLVSVSALLSQSAERAAEVSTVSAEFDMQISVGGQDFSFSGDMAFAEPGSMYMKMRAFGRRVEILIISPDMYMRMPDVEGWVLVDVTALGIDRSAFDQYLENHGLVDYEQIARNLQDTEQLPNDDIGGKTYTHYRGESDYAEMLADPSSSQLLNDQARELLSGGAGVVVVDTWIDPATLLPRRIVMDMDVSTDAVGDMQMTMTMDFLEYNSEVDIPERPADVRPLSELAEDS